MKIFPKRLATKGGNSGCSACGSKLPSIKKTSTKKK